MIAAVHHGGQLPVWGEVLLAAAEWGCPPWEVAGGGSPALWFFRWRVLADQRAQARQ